FRPRVRIHRPAAETDAAVPTVADRKDDPATEAAIGRPTVIGPGRKPRLDDLRFVMALFAQRLNKGATVVRRKADLEPVLRGLIQVPPRKVIARPGGHPGLQLQPEPAAGGLGHLQQLTAA